MTTRILRAGLLAGLALSHWLPAAAEDRAGAWDSVRPGDPAWAAEFVREARERLAQGDIGAVENRLSSLSWLAPNATDHPRIEASLPTVVEWQVLELEIRDS